MRLLSLCTVFVMLFFGTMARAERVPPDANLGDMSSTTIAFPIGKLAFLRTEILEAEVDFRNDHRLTFSELKFSKREVVDRGSLDHAYRTALFVSPYGTDYYHGFVESIGGMPVVFTLPSPLQLNLQTNTKGVEVLSYRKSLAITSLTLAGASFGAFIITEALAMFARSELAGTRYQKKAHEANEKYESFGVAAITTGALSAATGIASWLLWPNNRDRKKSSKLKSR